MKVGGKEVPVADTVVVVDVDVDEDAGVDEDEDAVLAEVGSKSEIEVG